MLKSIFLIFLMAFSVAQAAENQLSKQDIRLMVEDFYLNQDSHSLSNDIFKTEFTKNQQLYHCEDGDQRSSCVEILCEKTNCYGSTGREIAQACAGANGRCVKTLCEKTNCYGSTGREIAQSCRGSSGLCVEILCEKTNCYGSTGREIAQACVGADGQCVKTLCEKTNCYGSTGREIAQACAGQ